MFSTSRAILAAGTLLASASLALADGQMHQSPELVDAPVASAPSTAPTPVPVADRAEPRGRSGRRRTRFARERERRVARAAAELTRSIDPFGGIRHLTIGSVPAPLPPAHGDDVGSAVATLETPPPGNREAAAPTPDTSASAFEGAREAASHSLAELLAKHAFEEGVPVALAKAVVRIESGGNARATNHGALGLMQIKWATARAGRVQRAGGGAARRRHEPALRHEGAGPGVSRRPRRPVRRAHALPVGPSRAAPQRRQPGLLRPTPAP